MLGLLSYKQHAANLVICSSSARSRSPAPHVSVIKTCPSSTSSSELLYNCALHNARVERYKAAQGIFEALLKQEPRMCKAWVSYAMVGAAVGGRLEPTFETVCHDCASR